MSFDFNLFPTSQDGVKQFGWAGPDAAKEAWNKVKANFNPFELKGKSVKKKTRIGAAGERKRFIHQIVRKVLGTDLVNYAQRAGSCVSEGARSSCNYLSCTNIAVLNKSEKFRPSYAPYHYGTSRVFIGAKHGTDFGYNDDGSIGSYMAEAVQEYGNLFADVPGVEEYNGEAEIARRWGYRPGPKKEFVEQAKKHLVKSAARITSWDQLVEAITNGYPIHICSMLSFQMGPNSKGFHEQTNEGWAHCGKRGSFVNSYSGKSIEDIVVGDEVFGHDGKLHKVTETLKTEFNGQLIKINCGASVLTVTPNHPILAYVNENNDTDVSCYRNVDLEGGVATLPILKKEVRLVAKWMKASELKNGDYLVSPGYVFESTEDFPKFIVPSDGQKRNIPNDLFIDDDLAWFFGMYAGDGNSCPEGHKVRITLNNKEYDKALRCVKALNKLGLQATIKPVSKKNAIRVTCYSSVLAQFMVREFGKKQDKHLPNWIFTTGLNLREVANGLMSSDGHKTKKGRWTFSNTSKVLVNQLYTILISLGEKPCYYSGILKNKPHGRTQYKVEYKPNSNGQSKWINNHYLRKITNITTEDYNDYVYNLEVEDAHTYIMDGFISHNCMTITGVDDEWRDPYALILNSWGDSHGRITDFYDNTAIPVGTLRVRKSVLARALQDDDVEAFAFSDMDGFYERKREIDKALFDLFGN